jgi:hypothetical protein
MLKVVKCPYHHSMARPQLSGGRDGRNIWKVDANMLNKKSQIAEKGWSSSVDVVQEPYLSLPVNKYLIINTTNCIARL